MSENITNKPRDLTDEEKIIIDRVTTRICSSHFVSGKLKIAVNAYNDGYRNAVKNTLNLIVREHDISVVSKLI